MVTPVVAMLVLLNVSVYLLVQPGTLLYHNLTLLPAQIPSQPWTVITYQFLHGGFTHVFFNMLMLFVFGPSLELRLGNRRFLALYLVSGAVGGLLSWAIPWTRDTHIVGASGATYGVMLGFARFWPRQQIMLWGIVGVEARVLVGVFTLISLWSGFGQARDNVAHFAHLGGFLGGWLFLKWMERNSPAAEWKRKVQPPTARVSGTTDVERWRRINPADLHPVNREYLEQVLAKVAASGAGALSAGEREFLDRFSAR